MSALVHEPRPEGGFTIVEAVVTTAILLTATVISFNFLISATNATQKAAKVTTTENNTRLALRQITEDLRSANPIATAYPATSSCAAGSYPSGYPTCVSFTVSRATTAGQACPKTVMTYGLVNGSVKQDRVDYNASCVATSTVTNRTVLSSVVNPTTNPLFRFFDSSGNQIATTQPASSFASAASVQVTVVSQYQSGSPTLTVSSTAALRNNRV